MLYCLDFNAFFFVLLFSLNGCETFKRNNFNSKSKKTGENCTRNRETMAG